MSIKVRIPTPLQKLTANASEIEAEGRTVEELIDNLEKKFPGMKERITDDKGKVRRFVNIYVNAEDIRFKDMEKTKLNAGDEISIIPAIAGG